MVHKLSLFAGAGVALIILIDLATGQGPPGLYAPMGPPMDFRPPMPPMNFGPMNGGGGYESKREKFDKDSSKSIKDDHKDLKKPANDPFKDSKKEEKYDKDDKYDDDSSTPKPGMWDSLSNTWSSFTTLGRTKRGADDHKSSSARGFDSDSSLDNDSPYKQYGANQAYIFFKVPKNLICQ